MSSVSPADYRALAGFRYALRKFLRFSKEYLARHPKLTPEQYEALLAIQSFGPVAGLSVGELSERLQVKSHTAVALSNKLVTRKLATKERSAIDRREARVKLTPVGIELLKTTAAAHRKAIRDFIPEMAQALSHLRN